MRRKLVERLVHGEKFVTGCIECDVDGIDIDPVHPAAVANSSFTARTFNENAPHRFGGGGKKMSTTLPSVLIAPSNTNPCFVDERRRVCPGDSPAIFALAKRLSSLSPSSINLLQQRFRLAGVRCLAPCREELVRIVDASIVDAIVI
jgi:hypothetical protein